MTHSTSTEPNDSLQREIALMRTRSRQLSRRNAAAWCLLFVPPGLVAFGVLAVTLSEVKAVFAAICANWLIRSVLTKWAWLRP